MGEGVRGVGRCGAIRGPARPSSGRAKGLEPAPGSDDPAADRWPMPRPVEAARCAVEPRGGWPIDHAKDWHPAVPDSDRYIPGGLEFHPTKTDPTGDGTRRGGDPCLDGTPVSGDREARQEGKS